MHQPLRFETPENVVVEYHAAGLGTRFVAWFLDQLVLSGIMLVVLVGFLAAGASFEGVFRSQDGERRDGVGLYFIAMFTLVWGLGSFIYFGCSELFLGGQTVGKRKCKIRVVKSNGFQLDAASILLRNVFRVADHMPPMWLVPLISQRSQRSGDLVAGTVVVADGATELTGIRTSLSSQSAAESQFRFDQRQVGRLTPTDYATIERLLERETSLPADQRSLLLQTCTQRIAKKLGVETPPPEAQSQFLHDLFSAELRRQDRRLA